MTVAAQAARIQAAYDNIAHGAVPGITLGNVTNSFYLLFRNAQQKLLETWPSKIDLVLPDDIVFAASTPGFRKAYVTAKTGQDCTKPENSRLLLDYPTRIEMEDKPNVYPHHLGSGMVLLTVNVDGVDKIVQLERDADARTDPFMHCSPSGMGTEPLSIAPLAKLNEEIGLLLKNSNNSYRLALFEHQGVTGITEEKKAQQIDRVRTRAKAKYGNAFDSTRPIEVAVMPLQDDQRFAPMAAQVRIHNERGEVEDQLSATPVWYRDSNLVLERTLRLNTKDLRDGQNIFMVDTQSDAFERQAKFLTPKEMLDIHSQGLMSSNSLLLALGHAPHAAPCPAHIRQRVALQL